MLHFDRVAKNSEWSEELKDSIFLNTQNLFSKINYIKDLTKNPIGLMVGKIQSGKTGNLIGAAAHAFDSGYKLVIMYLSDQYALYEQNMLRVKESFKTDDLSIIFIDNSDISKDLSIFEQSPSDIDFHLKNNRKFLVCTLKHYNRINNISKVFSQTNITKEKVLIIDDEGDDISQNTSSTKHNPQEKEIKFTPNNKAIVNLMNKFKDYVFLSVTATPQAQLLIYKFESLSPNFCSLIYPGSDYTGLNSFHSGLNPLLVETVDDYSVLSDFNSGIPFSLKKSIVYFFLSGLFRSINNGGNDLKFHHSFLIHIDKLIAKQNSVYSKVETYIELIKLDFSIGKPTKETKLFEDLVENILLTERERFRINSSISFSAIKDKILEIIKETKIIVLNGTQATKNLKNFILGRKYFIVIGGDMLDRGLTIDGLAVSYFTRQAKKSQADTLLQRARWYGYKKNYLNYCKLYTTNHILDQFEAALEHENSVWDFLEIYENSRFDLRKIQTQFRIDTTLITPTSAAKAKWKNDGIEKWFVQNYFSRNPEHALKNQILIENFFKNEFLIDTFKSKFKNKVKKTNFENVYNFVSSFFFSENQKKDLLYYLNILRQASPIIVNKDFDVVFMRYETGEERKVIKDNQGDYLSNIMQGRSQDKDEYPGDREIISSNPMLQIHKVILKSDSGHYKKGDFVYTLAMGLPKDFILDNLIKSIDV